MSNKFEIGKVYESVDGYGFYLKGTKYTITKRTEIFVYLKNSLEGEFRKKVKVNRYGAEYITLSAREHLFANPDCQFHED